MPFGTLAPGASIIKTLHLLTTGAAGETMLDISVQSRPTALSADDDGDDESSSEHPELQDMTETLRTLVVLTVDPLKVTQNVVYQRVLGDWSGLADLKTFENDFWDDRQGGEAVVNVRMECVGPWGLEVESVNLERAVRVLHKSILDCH